MPQETAISIVDDDESIREALVGLMQSHGYEAEAFESGDEFLASEFRHRTQCLIVDMHMPGMSGIELRQAIVAAGDAVPSILITARYEDSVRHRALQAGFTCYLAKPFKEDDLLRCIGSALSGGTTESQ